MPATQEEPNPSAARGRSEVFAFRLPAGEADRLRALAERVPGRTPAALVRSLVLAALGVDEQAEVREDDSGQMATQARSTGSLRRRLTVRLSEADYGSVQELAGHYGGVTAWVRALVQERLGQVTERPAKAEVEALYEAVMQLWRVGNHLHQAVTRLAEVEEGRAVTATGITPALLGTVAQVVEVLAERNEAVIAAARRRVHDDG